MTAPFDPVQVQTYSGYKADEDPRGFSWQGHSFVIEQIVDRWYQAGRDPTLPSANYFKVRTTDGNLFIIRRDNDSLEWSLRAAP
ncbi:MAG: hypothetical protein ABSG38_06210 [Spirochaetia bacterium]